MFITYTQKQDYFLDSTKTFLVRKRKCMKNATRQGEAIWGNFWAGRKNDLPQMVLES